MKNFNVKVTCSYPVEAATKREALVKAMQLSKADTEYLETVAIRELTEPPKSNGVIAEVKRQVTGQT